ncbi:MULTISPECIES: adenylate kinase [Arthrobacter]|uniref:Adenylate kinase n=1 Tax=Arthrobacter terricola TaxID=2547396 RepID=A0A4R5KSA2_9MICC|nr:MULTISPECIES: adenylate kinase [Arthrobacter]MBT8160762.1 adenylate kinase [Arthrobacter sp. GN70]TDF97908.1 adenylate kinase [Arthrobacter terricola]
MARLIIMGPPGSGKGTQAEHIARHFRIPAISTGEIFRAHVGGKTALGTEASKYMDNGEFVPDHVTNAMVQQRLRDDDARSGFLLDGYPRTTAQIHALDTMLSGHRQRLDVVVELAVEDDILVARMLHRAQEQGRSDDTAPVFRRRLELYREQTQAVVAQYTARGIVVGVDGSGNREDITAKAIAAIESALGEAQ